VNDYYLHFRQEHFNTTNLNNIVIFSFCISLYRYTTTVYIFCQTEAANLHIMWKFPIS